MRKEWLSSCLRLCRTPADFYSGSRKIIRSRVITFEEIKDDLGLIDCGYTQYKMSYLKRGYMHEESLAVAHHLWERRCQQKKYGSVGFTTYNHFIKSNPDKKSKRGSVMGPCIQSVNLTLLPNKKTAVDVYYRTTEFFKKFPADLVFIRDVLLDGFEMDIESITFYFANITIHPMYFVTIIPLMIEDGLSVTDFLDKLKRRDPKFYEWTIKWTARYLCDEHGRGIAKFAQSVRVKKDAYERIPKKTLGALQIYLRDNHPGYRNDYTETEDGDDD